METVIMVAFVLALIIAVSGVAAFIILAARAVLRDVLARHLF